MIIVNQSHIYIYIYIIYIYIIIIIFLKCPFQCGVALDTVGVITPYRQQVWLLRQQLRQHNMTDVEVNTIDQYQGRDKDLIIMSFVKSQIFQSDHKVSYVERVKSYLSFFIVVF